MPTPTPRRRSTPQLERGVPPRRRRLLQILKWGALAALVGTALMAATIAAVFWIYGRDDRLPNITKLSDYKPKQVTVILDGEGQRVGEIFDERRRFVPYEKIPKVVIDAFVSAEDDRFFEHSGIDYMGMVRAFFVNLKSRSARQGASTITQQVVKNLVLSQEKTFKRKIQEIILARRLERSLTKQEILTLYLNEIYLGFKRYGVQEASRFYFGKDVEQLNAGEAAVLAAMPKAPEEINPKKNPARTKERQTYVLNRMVQLHVLKPEEAQRFIDEPIQVVSKPFPHLGTAPEWVGLVKKELIAEKGEKALDTLGAVVRTTMDTKVQTAAQAALEKALRAYDERHKIYRPVRKVKPDKVEAELAKLKKRLGRKGPQAGEAYDAVVLAVHDAAPVPGAAAGTPAPPPQTGELEVDLGDWKATVILGTLDEDRYNPAGDGGVRKKPSERFAAGDVVEVMLPAPGTPPVKPQHGERVVRLAPGPQGAIVAIKLPSREVAALVGGYSSRAADFNRATQAKRQPGSSFKPFVFAAAIDSGRYTAASLVNDAPEVYDLWKPQNYKKDNFEGQIRLRYALAKSINTAAIRVCHDVTPEVAAQLAARMGVASPLPRELSLALGSGEVTPLEMTNAVASFAAGGRFAPPRFVATVDNQPTAGVAPVEALRPATAYVVLDMMRSVVTEGTGVAASKLPIPVSGKTGTSNDSRDAWFIGLTPDWAIGIWLGFDDNRPLGGKETGGATATPVFVDVMRAIAPPAKTFTRPAGVAEARIDKKTGLLAPDGAPEGTWYTEVFLDGTVPTEVAPLPGEVDVNSFQTDAYGDEAPAEAGPVATPQ